MDDAGAGYRERLSGLHAASGGTLSETPVRLPVRDVRYLSPAAAGAAGPVLESQAMARNWQSRDPGPARYTAGTHSVLQRNQLHTGPVQHWLPIPRAAAAVPLCAGRDRAAAAAAAPGLLHRDRSRDSGVVHGDVSRRGARVGRVGTDNPRIYRW